MFEPSWLSESLDENTQKICVESDVSLDKLIHRHAGIYALALGIYESRSSEDSKFKYID